MTTSSQIFRPYVPRLAIEWLETRPDVRVQALEGSIVFVDISGFTKMSERLAKHGKVGAEEVTENLSAVFTKMLAVAYGEDGGLLKFGGDALFLWFGGDRHAERAARSAVGMRATLRTAGVLQTTAGKIVLRMSVGVHAGVFHFFLVGRGSHREFMITGPGASRTVQMEGAATAGEILASPEIAALLPPEVLGQPKDPGVLLKREPPGLYAAAAAEPGGDDVDLSLAVPLAIRTHLAEGEAEPEHRLVNVGFIHFDGTDELIEQHGGDAAAEALDELVTDVQEAADANGVTFLGTDVDHDGGKIIVIGGAPRATGDDEERMLLTLRQVVVGDRRLPVRIGLNRGHVFVGDVGPRYRRTYTVMGDAVNLAARRDGQGRAGTAAGDARRLGRVLGGLCDRAPRAVHGEGQEGSGRGVRGRRDRRRAPGRRGRSGRAAAGRARGRGRRDRRGAGSRPRRRGRARRDDRPPRHRQDAAAGRGGRARRRVPRVLDVLRAVPGDHAVRARAAAARGGVRAAAGGAAGDGRSRGCASWWRRTRPSSRRGCRCSACRSNCSSSPRRRWQGSTSGSGGRSWRRCSTCCWPCCSPARRS